RDRAGPGRRGGAGLRGVDAHRARAVGPGQAAVLGAHRPVLGGAVGRAPLLARLRGHVLLAGRVAEEGEAGLHGLVGGAGRGHGGSPRGRGRSGGGQGRWKYCGSTCFSSTAVAKYSLIAASQRGLIPARAMATCAASTSSDSK